MVRTPLIKRYEILKRTRCGQVIINLNFMKFLPDKFLHQIIMPHAVLIHNLYYKRDAFKVQCLSSNNGGVWAESE